MNELTTTKGIDWGALKELMVHNNLAVLTPQQQLQYVMAVCQSLRLNPLTKPFDIIEFKDKDKPRIALYANKNCAEQLRKEYGITIEISNINVTDTEIIVSAKAKVDGRVDEDYGIVPLPIAGRRKKKDGGYWDYVPTQEDISNAKLKAITKAKRRVTFSICGLGMLDETEISDIVGVKNDTHKVIESTENINPDNIRKSMIKGIRTGYKELGELKGLFDAYLKDKHDIIIADMKLEGRSDDQLLIIFNSIESFLDEKNLVEGEVTGND